MELELRCPVCHDFFKDPVMLNCTHHVCMAHVGTVAAHERLTCPACQDVTSVPEGGLVVEKTLQVIVDMFQQQQLGADGIATVSPRASAVTAQMCGFCEEQLATRRCVQCAGVLCADCVTTSHSKGFFKSHNIVDLTQEDSVSAGLVGQMLCDTHPEEKLTFYCLDCRKSVCSHCLILGSHKGHQQTPIDNAFETGKETLGAWSEKLSSRIQNTQDLLEQLRSAELEVNRGAEAQRSVINNEMDHLRELVETKRQQLLSKSGLEERQKRAQLQAQMDRAETAKSETLHLVARSTGLLGQISEHAFLAVVLPLIQDMKKCASQNLDVSPTVACAFRPLTTDAQVRSLGDLDLGHPRSVPQQQQAMPVAHAVTSMSSQVRDGGQAVGAPQLANYAPPAGGYTQQSATNATMAYLPQQSVPVQHQQLQYVYRVPQ